MAVADGVNPTFPGVAQAASFKTDSGTVQTKAVRSNGTTTVSVLGATKNFTGSIVAIRVIADNEAANTITFLADHPDDGVVQVGQVVKSTTAGAVVGTSVYFSSGRFSSTGSVVLFGSGTSADATVEVDFVTH